jgi:Asp-tRNA(Asn)/Glu-tRNA(Gln) amidotransferase A subunit family amidase
MEDHNRAALVRPVGLGPLAAALRSGEVDPVEVADGVWTRIAACEPMIRALVSEPGRLVRVTRDAGLLREQHPDAATRPPLYGVSVGIKDIFGVDGLPTKAGSRVPARFLAGEQGSAVERLLRAGAVVCGKTVAAGYCPLAIGTQTAGSVIRPAAFCGVVGFKPTYGRIPTDGVIAASPSFDTVGTFTADVDGARIAASVLCDGWRGDVATRPPVLGVPDGPFLAQAEPAALEAFELQVAHLAARGLEVRRVPVLDDIAGIAHRHRQLMACEMAEQHGELFDRFERLYRPGTAAFIRHGRGVAPEEAEDAHRSRDAVRAALEGQMDEHGLDVWASPAAPGPAPLGLASTGDSRMNIAWMHAGMPVVTVPSGWVGGMPVGLQCAARPGSDEELLAWSASVEGALAKAVAG